MTEHKCNESFSQRKADVTNVVHLIEYFCSDTVFNLSKGTEIKLLEKV